MTFRLVFPTLIVAFLLAACGGGGTESGGLKPAPVDPVDPDFKKFSDAYDLVGKAQGHPKIEAALDILLDLDIPEHPAVMRHMDKTYLARDLRSTRDDRKIIGVYHYRHIGLDIDYIERSNKIRVAGLLVHEARHANRPFESEDEIDLHESRVVALLGGTESDIRNALAKRAKLNGG